MSNIINLAVPSFSARASKMRRLAQGFAAERRGENDVFWLKENAEFLNVAETTSQADAAALKVYEPFYDTLEVRFEFFPQYYRFLLSICLDYEDLRGGGNKGEKIAHWVANKGIAQAELSDLQRLEAVRLTARRGVEATAVSGVTANGLRSRVQDFMCRSTMFSQPNKKIAYELTHAVFYLSDYGRKDPALDAEAITSLEFVGLWAFVEQNADLVAEICVALTFAGQVPPKVWIDWLSQEAAAFGYAPAEQAVATDQYHAFLMCHWALMTTGAAQDFGAMPPAGVTPVFNLAPPAVAPLRELSECLFNLQDARSRDWDRMRPRIWAHLSPVARKVVECAESSSPRFSEFFEGFARVGLLTRALP
ncbi:MAG: DUF6902 family protein [Shimia sp.]|jgi:hypothetical protein|uniref:DUF6902 family protein n=1 Tax=Shimia sp. TaxID=1954381 RepID=UPI00405A3698